MSVYCRRSADRDQRLRSTEDLKRATAAGFDHYLVKPVDLPSLCTLLSQAATPALMK